MATVVPWNTRDEDGGVVSVPNTSVWTRVYTYIPNQRFNLRTVRVAVYDAAALSVVEWRLLRNGNPIKGLSAQRTLTFDTNVQDVQVNEQTFPLEEIAVEARNGGAAAHDVLARITGEDTRWA